MEQERIVYKIDTKDFVEKDILSNLKITEYLPIQDNGTNNKFIVNKLGIGDLGKKLFIETSYLKVLSVDGNKLYLELPQSHIDFFDTIDDKCAELLGDLVNGESNLDISELYGQMDLMGYNDVDTFDITNVEYKSLIDTNSGIIKINIFSSTTIKQSGKNISSSKINPGDDVRLVIGLDYISLLVDTSNLLARTKIYCYFIEVSKKYTYVPIPREKINNWEFTSCEKKKTDIFIKTDTTENDNFDVYTEINNNDKHKLQSINLIGGDKLEHIDECENENNNESDDNNKSENENDNDSISIELNSVSNSSSIGKNLKNDELNELNNMNDENMYIDTKIMSSVIEENNSISENMNTKNVSNKNISKRPIKKTEPKTSNKKKSSNKKTIDVETVEINKIIEDNNKNKANDIIELENEKVSKTRAPKRITKAIEKSNEPIENNTKKNARVKANKK
jgi:hypothetical protein